VTDEAKKPLSLAGKMTVVQDLMQAWEDGEFHPEYSRDQMHQKVLDFLEHGELALLEPEGSA
jgi:hypothetical protein